MKAGGQEIQGDEAGRKQRRRTASRIRKKGKRSIGETEFQRV